MKALFSLLPNVLVIITSTTNTSGYFQCELSLSILFA